MIRVVSQEFGAGDICEGPEEHDGPYKAGVLQRHALVRGKLGHGVAEHNILPVVLGMGELARETGRKGKK